ncbi:MAG: MBL fold metallo-hydrolase [Lachnospiraceae bacterium]|nr:MBL fold metallo-hydrolase [Lachnospiraceae bacterium]
MLSLLFRWHPGVEITFLSVGQGDGILVQEGNFTMLVDGGSSSNNALSSQTLLPFIKCQGIQKLNLVLITHWDADHYNGIMELLESEEGKQVRVGKILLPDTGGELHNEGYEKIMEVARGRNIPIRYLKTGDLISSETIKLTVLNPNQGYVSDNINDYSIVTRLEYGAFSCLLTGDVTGEAEEMLADKVSDVMVLKVAHHGSNYSTPVEFLNSACPKYAVISVGKKNRYGHPGEELLERLEASGARIYRTDQAGAVMVWTDGEKMTLKTFLQPEADK